MRILPIAPFILLAACQPAAPDPRGVDHDETLLTVSATGRAEARPDEARFTVGVRSIAGTAAEASRLNNEKMAKVSAALTRFGIKPDDLQTRNLTLNRIDYGSDKGRFDANNQVEVRLKDLARAGEAIAATTDAGANLLSGPTLRVTDREAATKSAYAAAYRAARTRAEAYAEAAGLKISRVLAIRDGGQVDRGPWPVAEQSMDAAVQVASPAPPPFNPGMNSSDVSVRVDFALEK